MGGQCPRPRGAAANHPTNPYVRAVLAFCPRLIDCWCVGCPLPAVGCSGGHCCSIGYPTGSGTRTHFTLPPPIVTHVSLSLSHTHTHTLSFFSLSSSRSLLSPSLSLSPISPHLYYVSIVAKMSSLNHCVTTTLSATSTLLANPYCAAATRGVQVAEHSLCRTRV